MARKAGRRLATRVTSDADEQRDDDRAGLEREAVVRQREADGVEELEEALAEGEAEEEADDRRDQADHERLEDDRAQHLSPRGAERAQGRELAGALRDRDRERVGDHERADEERNAREREQERLQEADEAVRVLRVARRLGVRRSSPGCRAAGSGGSPRRARSGETPLFAPTRIWSSLPVLSKRRWAVGRSKPASVAPPMVETAPNLTRPETRSRSTGPCACTPICWPILMSFFPAVDSSTTTSPDFGHRPPTRVRELNSGCVGSTLKPRFGAPPKTIALPFLPISCASPPDAADRRLHVRQRLHLRQQRLVEGRGGRRPTVREIERRLAADDRVRSVVALREDRVEGIRDRVGEDVGAADHRDAEDDRDRRQRRAELVAEKALECERRHESEISAVALTTVRALAHCGMSCLITTAVPCAFRIEPPGRGKVVHKDCHETREACRGLVALSP